MELVALRPFLGYVEILRLETRSYSIACMPLLIKIAFFQRGISRKPEGVVSFRHWGQLEHSCFKDGSKLLSHTPLRKPICLHQIKQIVTMNTAIGTHS